MQSGRQPGFIYIGLLIGLAIVGIGLTTVTEVATHSAQRDREEDLLFVGNQIRQAITRYYNESPAASRRFPMHLEDMLEDTRTPGKVNHYLRKLYRDPLTNTREWGEVRLAGGQLVGVYSLSTEKPIRSTGFAQRDKDFKDKDRYSEWVFRSPLPAANPLLKPDASYSTNGLPPGAGPGAGAGAASADPIRIPRPANPPPPGVIQPMPRPR